MASGMADAPKLRPPAGTPPMGPASTVIVSRLSRPSSKATEATPSGMPMPRLITAPSVSSSAARRAITFRSSRGMGGMSGSAPSPT